MTVVTVVTAAIQAVEQDQSLVQRKGPDRVLQEQLPLNRRQRAQWEVTVIAGREEGDILDAFAFQLRGRGCSHLTSVFDQAVGVWAPVGLHLAGEVSHGIGFDPYAGDALLLALNDRRAGATERVQYLVAVVHPEAF